MINTAKYLEEAMAFVRNKDLEFMHEDFILQTDYLKSEDYNHTLNAIEAYLTDLYDKTRTLEDIIAYSKEYIKTNIYSCLDDCRAILSVIEDDADSQRTRNYITTPVTFEASSGSQADRDNKVLPSCAVSNGLLTLSSKEDKVLEIKSLQHINSMVPYRHNLNDLKAGKPYRSYYLLDNPIKDGLKEEIQVNFVTPDSINHLNIVTSNCEVSNVKYNNTNGTTEYVDNYRNLHILERETKSLSFVLTAKNYKTVTYYVDESRIKSNFWEKIKEYEYTKATGGTSTLTQAQIDELSGLTAFKAAYEQYIKDLKSWIEKRESIIKQNIANGYSDSMPTIDFIVAPEKFGIDISSITKLNESSAGTAKASTDTTSAAANSRTIVAASNYENPNKDYYPAIDTVYGQIESAAKLADKSFVNKTGDSISLYTTSIGTTAKYTKAISK